MRTADEIKNWLKKINKNREWLGEKTFVRKRQVDNWLSSGRKIPEAKMLIIEQLMNEPNEVSGKKELLSLPNPEGLDRITIEVDGELQIRINKKALELGMTTSCWASLALEEAAGEPDIMEKVERLYAKKNAERAKSGTNSRHNTYIPENQKADSPDDIGENPCAGTELFGEDSQEHQNPNSPIIITGLTWEEETPA